MTGGSICSVATCDSNSRKAKEQGENLSFFTFPTNPAIRRAWVRKCYRKDKFNPKCKRICSKHFRPEDFEDILQARIMGSQPKKLKKNAIPSLLLRPREAVAVKPSRRAVRMQQKENKELVAELLKESPSSHSEKVVQGCEDVESPSSHSEKVVQGCEDVENIIVKEPEPSWSIREAEYDSLKQQLETLKQQLETLKTENEFLKEKISLHENNEIILQQRILDLDRQLTQEHCQYIDRVKLAFKDFLTAKQVDVALKKKTRARWSQEELSRAFTLRYFSKRCYLYLRNTLHYPLPGISTLQKWAANMKLRNGILDDVLRVMQITGTTKTDRNRTTVLSFDEVKVSSLYEYEQKDDEVVGPHSYMQVVMGRGLFDNWKQPVYVGFDQKVTKQILEDVIAKLHAINYNVVACVSDCGGGNQGLWKELKINIDNTHMSHPCTGLPIYFFGDVPHLLKLLRNWFLDTGFILGTGQVLTVDPIKALLEATKTEINACHKLTDTHILCERTQRQNVRLAAELFSNTTATALEHYRPGGDPLLARNLGKFVQMVNNWFDIMNSYSLNAKIPTKKPYGLSLDLQDTTLNEMKRTVGNMLCQGKKTLQVFQKGIIISINSLQGLFKHLRETLQITYILTHRLNQDCLENFFSQLRTRGGLHDHPSPLNALHRMRMILLGKNPGLVHTHANVEIPSEANDEYLLPSALKKAHIQSFAVGEELTVEPTLDEEAGSVTSSTSTSSNASDTTVSENDGLLYVAGYLAKKHLNKYSYLGQHTYKTSEINIHSYAMPSWVQSLSFGGLIQPSNEWLQQIKHMEKYFRKLHKQTFRKMNKIVHVTSNYIASRVRHLNIPKELIKAFTKQRVFIRIKYLNLKKEAIRLGKRKASPGAHSRKTFKKLKKICQ